MRLCVRIEKKINWLCTMSFVRLRFDGHWGIAASMRFCSCAAGSYASYAASRSKVPDRCLTMFAIARPGPRSAPLLYHVRDYRRDKLRVTLTAELQYSHGRYMYSVSSFLPW